MFSTSGFQRLFICAIATCSVSAMARASLLFGGADEYGGYPTSYIVVRFTPDIEPVTGVNGQAAIDGGAIDEARAAWGCTEIKRALPFAPLNARLADRVGLTRSYMMVVPHGTQTQSMAEAFAMLPGVEFAETDGIGGIAGDAPNDPDFDIQWSLKNTGQAGGVIDADINILAAWDVFPGDNSVTIAMLDTGIQQSHPDLAGSGRFVPGWNTVDNNDITDDPYGHGTHTAGIAGAIVNNATGIAGINRYAKLMPVRVVDSQGMGTEAQCAAGIVWAADHGAKVISMSLQYFEGTELLNSAVQYAYQSGCLCVAASGNQSWSSVTYPAAFDHCMAITATDRYDELFSSSNTGPDVDIAAPGAEIWSTWKNGLYQTSSGTSMAAPMVSGVASLMWGRNHSLTVDRVVQILRETAHDIGDPGIDDLYGAGRLDAYAALMDSYPLGDMNCDGVLNNFDIDAFVVAILDQQAYGLQYANCNIMRGDMDRSGQVDNFDIDGFVNALLSQ